MFIENTEKTKLKTYSMMTYNEIYAEVTKAVQKQKLLSPIRAVNSVKEGKEVFVTSNDIVYFRNLAHKMKIKCIAKYIYKDGAVFVRKTK